jgi:hypothetical protein
VWRPKRDEARYKQHDFPQPVSSVPFKVSARHFSTESRRSRRNIGRAGPVSEMNESRRVRQLVMGRSRLAFVG